MRRAGGQGHRLPGLRTAGNPNAPAKEKTKGTRTPSHPETINQVISRVRVTVEHAIAGVKRCRIGGRYLPQLRQGMVDEVMLAASGLHNLRVARSNLRKSSIAPPPTASASNDYKV